MNLLKGMISHYKWTGPDIRWFIPIYKYIWFNFNLKIFIYYQRIFKSHSLTALIGWDWDQGSEEYSSVQSLVQQPKGANCTPMV